VSVRRLASITLATALAVALGVVPAGCGGRARPPSGPTPEIRAEVERAEAAELARRHDAAREHYLRAVAEARDLTSVAYARREYAETLISWGEYPEAIAQLEGSVAARPSAAAWHDLGLLRNHQGDTRGALAALEQARALAPRDPRPRVALAALRWKSGDRAGAAVEYRALLELPLPERVRAKVQWALGELAKP
jgi:Flp pilus assembly protein TadD